jgi:Mrp family chromosome partitioning ATPase
MKRIADRAAWMRARATNALRRPVALALYGVTFAALGLAALLLVPGRTEGAATAAVARIPERPDSTTPARVRDQAQLQLARADSILAAARQLAVEPVFVPVDTLPPYLRARRDTLATAVRMLDASIARAQSAPLPSSYRVLGESPVMIGVPGVRGMLDSLAAIERERESFGAVSGVDPMYIALTARVNAVGRSIITAAQNRRAAIRAEYVRLLPPRPPPRPVLTVDTLRTHEERAEAASYLLGATAELARIRERNSEIDAIEARARELREVGASFSATAAAALVVGIALGFALVFLAEMREPRVADAREAERVTRVRVMAVAQTRDVVPERARRESDIGVPDVLDPFAEHYRRIYLHLTTRDDPVVTVTITGDDPELAAIVAVNLAAYDVREARSALIVDTDPVAASVARALGIPHEPGLSDVLLGELSWPDAMRYVDIGRDQTLAVMPSGRRAGKPQPERAARVRADLGRLSGRHDLIVFTAAVEQAREDPSSVLLSRDVVVCVRLGHTRIRTLRSEVEQLRTAGMTIHGLLLWDAERPDLPAKQRETRARAATAETAAV